MSEATTITVWYTLLFWRFPINPVLSGAVLSLYTAICIMPGKMIPAVKKRYAKSIDKVISPLHTGTKQKMNGIASIPHCT